MKSPAGLTNAKHWAIRLTVAFAVAALSACIIGPKQDDPETAATTESDTGSVEDTTHADPADTGVATTLDEAGFSSDTSPAADAAGSDSGTKSACGDAGDASDAGDADGAVMDAAGCRKDGGSDALTAD